MKSIMRDETAGFGTPVLDTAKSRALDGYPFPVRVMGWLLEEPYLVDCYGTDEDGREIEWEVPIRQAFVSVSIQHSSTASRGAQGIACDPDSLGGGWADSLDMWLDLNLDFSHIKGWDNAVEGRDLTSEVVDFIRFEIFG